MKICHKVVSPSDKTNWINQEIIEQFFRTNTSNAPMLKELIFSACDYAEGYTRRSIVRKSITVLIDPGDRNADGSISLPYPPVISINGNASAKQRNPGDDSATKDTDNLVIEQGLWLPSSEALSNNRRLTYTAGYGSMSDMPPALLYAILNHASSLYINRSGTPPASSQAAYTQFRQIKL